MMAPFLYNKVAFLSENWYKWTWPYLISCLGHKLVICVALNKFRINLADIKCLKGRSVKASSTAENRQRISWNNYVLGPTQNISLYSLFQFQYLILQRTKSTLSKINVNFRKVSLLVILFDTFSVMSEICSSLYKRSRRLRCNGFAIKFLVFLLLVIVGWRTWLWMSNLWENEAKRWRLTD